MDRFVDQTVDSEVPLPWLWRTLSAAEGRTRPLWGWGVLIACCLLTMLPAIALRANRLLALGNYQTALELTGPLAVVVVWGLWGWREQQRANFGWLALIASLLCGVLLVSELLLGWIPGPQAIWQAVVSGAWPQIPAVTLDSWTRAATRFALWREGVAAGGAAQDDLVFATIAATILWLVGTASALLARGLRQGLAAGAPSLWLLGLILLYSSGGRYLLLFGLILTLAMHIMLDQAVLTRRWQRLGLDYSPGLLMDRILAALSAGAVILTLAAVMPNLYITPLVNRYYELLSPLHVALEATGERLFPELRGTSRIRGGGGSGMPNEFLLRGGPDLGSALVMRVRTNETPLYQFPFDEMAPPPGHYMRGRTLTVYDGRGWSNAGTLAYAEFGANERWEAESWGRKQVVQSIILETNSTILFAAPEPVEASANVRLESRTDDDLAAVQGREASYTVVSMVPAVSEDTLRSLPAWAVGESSASGEITLPEQMRVHLEVPPVVTERTRELAQQLVSGRATQFDQAQAIEQYLRQYTYDLDVPEPPAEVTEIADYFLFELQRGYCDYYATAFIVLARLAGLPTRFATGYAPGLWDPVEGVFVISESDAHSWPEVYFPEVGWVPFEPTAGRSQLARTGLPESSTATSAPPPALPAPVERVERVWNWQLAVWLLPLAGLLWLLWAGWQWWLRRNEDPWQSVLQWGKGVGRPIDAGETVLEYGYGLAGYVMRNQKSTQDAGRVAAREIQALSEEVNRLRYARAEERDQAKQSLDAHWERLRNYLRLVRIG